MEEDRQGMRASEIYHTQSGRLESEGKQSVQGSIAIKGTRGGLLLTLEPDMPFSELLQALTHRLEESPSFFRGATLTIDTTRRSLRIGEKIQLEKLLAQYQMSMASPERKDAKTITLPPESSQQSNITRDFSKIEPVASMPDLRDNDSTLYLRRIIRSGQAIRHHSNVVILGDVNAGAEIIAGGDVIVWGVLRGMVHAGYPDNEQALVCSLQLAPVQLRIAHLLSRPPEDFEAQPRPEIASIRQGQIIVEAWLSARSSRR
jgi:septum site-determining protein MinC